MTAFAYTRTQGRVPRPAASGSARLRAGAGEPTGSGRPPHTVPHGRSERIRRRCAAVAGGAGWIIRRCGA
ncbi:hypothetical protein [Kitasatospora sp. NPDC097643]|uniref:hypothetical protein n=1 Tax=Kitasatospora sp. NPDC097643 TaxID=3157230 RepID=UPI0033181AF0